MQYIGNTYQAVSNNVKNNIASNGNVNSVASKNNASDFSVLLGSLSSISKNSSKLTDSSLSLASKNTNSFVRTDKNSLKTHADNKHAVKLNSKSVNDDMDVCEDEEISSERKNAKSTDKDFVLSDSTEIILDGNELFSVEDSYKSGDNSAVSNLMSADDVNALNQKIELVDNIVQKSSSLIEASPEDLEKVKNSLLNLSNEELTALDNSDDAKLTEFINKAISSNLQAQATSKTALNVDREENEGLDSWFNELLADADVEDVKVTAKNSENSDFGADDFDLIERSLKLSRTLDDTLAKADVKSKIDSIMDSKEEASENTLARSLELLKGVVGGKTDTAAASGSIATDNSALNMSSDNKISSNGFQSLEQAIKSAVEGSNTAMSSELSQDGGSFENQQPFQSMLQQSAASSKENAQTQITKQFDLLSMSSNLKQNAQALTEKVMQMASKNLKTMDLTLNPEGLGKMKISLDVTDADDITRISISASSPATKALVEQGMEALRQTLRDNNINAQTEVTEYDNSSSNQNQEGRGEQQEFAQNNGHSQNETDLNYGTFFASDEDTDNVSENLAEDIINSQNGDSVSYFA